LSVNRVRTARRIVLDRWASRVVVVGGIIIIACILAILFVIALEVYPLFKPASATLAGTYGTVVDDSGRPAAGSALGVDEYREIAFVVTRGGALSLVRCRLVTGRRHQIRVQLADVGCPIVGDKKYGAKTDPVKRLALHACALKLLHPVTQKELRFVSPLPRELARLV
jgi:ABC-type uncharacterized transport system permease subunit